MRSIANVAAPTRGGTQTTSPTSSPRPSLDDQDDAAPDGFPLHDYALDRDYHVGERRLFGFPTSGTQRAISAPYLALDRRPSNPEPLTEADFAATRGVGELNALVTLREGVFRRDLLRWDTERYFAARSDAPGGEAASVSDTVGTHGTVEQDTDPRTVSLDSLLEDTQGLIIGRDRRQIRAAAHLERALPALVAKGLKTLFLSEIPRDLFQEALDSHFASQADSLPGTVEAFLLSRAPGRQAPGLGYGTLIETAHRLGVKVQALDSAAGFREEHGGVPLFLKMPIYESLQVIAGYKSSTAAAADGKWIALTDVDRLSGALGVPGLAALTGATGVRVADYTGATQRRVAPAYTSTIVPDPGGLDTPSGRPQSYLQERRRADYLMTISSAADAPSREAGAPMRNGPTAARDDDRRPVPPRDIAAYTIDPLHRAEVLADVAMSGSAYAIREMARNVKWGNGLDYVPDNDAREQAIVDLLEKRKMIREDASRHFSALYQDRGTFSTQTNPALEALRQGGAINVGDLLRSPTSGIAFGESHGADEPLAFMIGNMGRFKALGVHTFFFEHIPHELFQEDLDAHFLKPGTALPAALNGFLQKLHSGHTPFGNTKHHYVDLILAAHRAGIRVVAIDNVASYNEIGLPDYARQEMMNYHAMRIINATTSEHGEQGKWIALLGNSHINTYKGVPGVAELTGATGVDIRKGQNTRLRPGWSDVRHNHGRLLALHPDAVLDIALDSDLSEPLA